MKGSASNRTYELSDVARQAAKRGSEQTLFQGISKVGAFKSRAAARLPTNELVYRLLEHPG